MSRAVGTRPRRAALAVVATLVATSAGCGAMIDTAYLLGDGRRHESTEERRPTAEQRTRIEHQATVTAAGDLVLTCEERTRTVERTWQVHKTFKQRGGYDRGTYLGAASVSGLFTMIIGGAALGICLSQDDVSCWHVAWATPYALDVVWSGIRAGGARDPVLVAREPGPERLELGRTPMAQAPAVCPGTSLVVGFATGPSDDDELNGRGGTGPRRPAPGAAALLPTAAAGTFTLAGAPEALAAWTGAGTGLWAVDAEGAAHPVEVDRCAALRPHVASLTGPALASMQRACPPPAQPGAPANP
ncbi:MAG: hypothetical protein KBG28_21490 [Kofleriaceae bacterium]|nr:hypothetical protein [Kofleriaceae bacterium]MBP6839944.1 hypothetical protein [Kofleriaceae bacterium]MBP9206562.1 hypothetical protein [Kofleriaceae bacterium]